MCVCTSVRPHPRDPVPGEEPGGLGVPQEAATPGLISHSPENLPTILTLLAGQTPLEGQEGANSETPSFPQHVFLTHSCLLLHRGPVALHGQSSPQGSLPPTTVSILHGGPRGQGSWAIAPSSSIQLKSRSTGGLLLVWAHRTLRRPRAS